jgi:glycosyltransferase involved in cell wall biosynthesis
MPRVSVIMAAYNAEKYLKEAIGSILSQTLSDFELIVVNDCSTDRTSEILRSYDDARMRVVTHHKNEGVATSRNDAIKIARGGLIAVMDADDISYPDRLKVQVAFMDSHPDVGLVGSAIYDNIDEEGFVLYTSYLPEDNEAIQETLLRKWCFVHPSIMFRKVVVEKAGGYRKEFEPAEDHDFILRVLDYYKAWNLRDKLLAYRINPKGLSVVAQDYINELGEVAMRLAAKRRRGDGENLEIEMAKVTILKERARARGAVSRTLQKVRNSLYASKRYYGFGCKELYVGNATQARKCFIRSLKNNWLFARSWVALCLSFIPFSLFKKIRFVFEATREFEDEMKVKNEHQGESEMSRGGYGGGASAMPKDHTLNISQKITRLAVKYDLMKFITAIVSEGMLSLSHFATAFLLVRYAEKAEYGIYVILFSIVGIFGAYQTAMINGPLMVLANRKEGSERENYVWGLTVGKNVIFGPAILALVMGGILYSLVYSYPSSYMGLSILLGTVITGYLGKEFYRTQKFIALDTSNILKMDIVNVLSMFAVILLLMYWNAFSSATGMCVLGVGYFSAYLFANRDAKRVMWKSSEVMKEALKENWHFGKWMVAGCTFTLIQERGYIYIVSAILGLSTLAEISAARLLFMPIGLLNACLGKIFVAKGSMMVSRHEEREFSRLVIHLLGALTIIWFVYFATMELGSNTLIGLLGEKYSHTKDLVSLWGAYFLVYTWRYQLGMVLVVHQQFKKVAVFDMCGSAVAIISCFILSWALGGWGASVSLAMGELVTLTLYVKLYLKCRRQPIGFTPQPVVTHVGEALTRDGVEPV